MPCSVIFILTCSELGIFLNNELTDFSAKGRNQISGGRKLRKTALEPDNTSYGGKRPRSSMTPTIIMKNDQPHLLVGSPGGTSIIGIILFFPTAFLVLIQWSRVLDSDRLSQA